MEQVIRMALNQKTKPRFPETGNGTMPKCKVVYLQCKAVAKGNVTPFSLGDVDFSRRRAKAFVKGVERNGSEFIKRNYPVLCDKTI